MRIAITVLPFACAAALSAQTPVGQALESPRVRAVVNTEKPNNKGPLHEHKYPRVVVYLDDGEITYTSKDGKADKIRFKKGDVRWFPAGWHTSENTGGKPFRQAEMDIKDKPLDPPRAISELDPLKVASQYYSKVFENEHVRVLRVKFGPKEKGVLHTHTFENVVVYMVDQARGKTGEMRLDGPRTHTEENPLDIPVERISVDLK
jgi:quercetin dioxygenase-like cupin family protein